MHWECKKRLNTKSIFPKDGYNCKHLLYWSRGRDIELFNSWDLSAEQQKKLDNYWKRFQKFREAALKWVDSYMGAVQSSTRYSVSLKEFISRLGTLLKEANYPVKHNERFLMDFLMLSAKGLFQSRECSDIQWRSQEGEVRRVSRQTTPANEYRSTFYQYLQRVPSPQKPVTSW